MSLWTRIANSFRGGRLDREIAEEVASHLSEAAADGRDPAEARRAFGGTLRAREESRDAHVFARLDSLRADTVFAWRQFRKHKVTTAAAVLSLALAVGACTSAFRLIDAVLLRPLPVKAPEQLYTLARQGIDFDGSVRTGDLWAYPDFRLMRAAAKGRAELIAVSYAQRADITYKSDAEMETAIVQYVSGWMFDSFGLRPALGRLLTENDDLKPRAGPYAVLSYDYWTRRFGRDPNVVGRSLKIGDDIFRVVGVGPKTFTGTETGTVTDLFVPAMMYAGATHDDWTWHRTLARVHPGVAMEPLRGLLDSTSRSFEEGRFKGYTGLARERIARFLSQKLVMTPAAAGASGLQRDYGTALTAIGVLVLLVLLIACANVANLMTAQAAARGREMALRVSLGAGRGRLVQLVLVEGAWLALLSALAGAWVSWWSAPFVVAHINPPDNPVRLALPADGRVLAFGMALTLAVTLLFGLAPALRASKVSPASTLRGGAADPRARRRVMNGLVAAQVAFCFLVVFLASLFGATFERLAHGPRGFSADRILTVDAVAPRQENAAFWDQAAGHLRNLPGVEKVSLSGWALLFPNAWNGFVSVHGAPPDTTLAYFMPVSPGWFDSLKISLVEGRDFRPHEGQPDPAIVNQTFARHFFRDENPLGATFAKGDHTYVTVGVVRDVPYRSLREDILPAVYVPFDSWLPARSATFVVRTASANPLAMASLVGRDILGARVSEIRTEENLVDAQTVRERLLAMLALFFAAVALLLAGIGLYGVLDYSVLQRRREIGIRMAIGARAGAVVRGVTAEMFRMVVVGALAGLGLGLLTARYVSALLYQVRPGDPAMLAAAYAIILGAAALAAVPAVLRALRIDPASMLRAD